MELSRVHLDKQRGIDLIVADGPPVGIAPKGSLWDDISTPGFYQSNGVGWAKTTAGAFTTAFQPSSISSLVAWHEARAQTEGIGNAVATLVGVGGKPSSQTQSVVGKRPILQTIAGAQTALRFDAVDDSIVLATSTALNARPCTVMVVYAATNVPASPRRAVAGDDSSSHNWLMGPRSDLGGKYAVYAGGFISADPATYPVTAGLRHVHLFRQPSSGNSDYRIDGVSVGTPAGINNPPGVLAMGINPTASTEPAECDIIALLAFSDYVTGTDLTNLESWAAAQFM